MMSRRLRVAAWSVALLAVAGAACAYLTVIPTYEAMWREAEVVVIATPVARREVGKAALPGVSRGEGQPIPAIEVETTFRVRVALRGRVGAGGQLRLVHFIEAEPPAAIRTAGPFLVDFEPGSGDQYLMFLKREAGGRYQAYQETEPGWCIEKLQIGLAD
jgi:hypothetical protein